MNRPPLVGLIDGALPAAAPGLETAASFVPDAAAPSPGAGHAAALAGTIGNHAPSVRFANAAIFGARLAVSRAALTQALAWVLPQAPDVLHCSFGLPADDAVLADLFERAMRVCRFVVAAAPARGRPVFPAAYPGVIAVSGDARCGTAQWSWLNTAQVDFGACVQAVPEPGVRGASAAAAHFTGLLCARLASGAPTDVVAWMQQNARWQGPERRRF